MFGLRLIGSVTILVIFAGAAVPQTSPSPPAAPVSSLAGWTSLTLEARKALIFSGKSTIAVSEGTHSATGRPAVVFKTASMARVFGIKGFEEETTSYIDRERRRPLEFFQMRPRESARRYVFLQGSIRQTSWEPPEGGRDMAFGAWREIETIDRKFTYVDGATPRPDEWFTDFYSLLYLLRDVDLLADPKPAREYTTLYRRHLMRIRVTPGERRGNEREAFNEATGALEKLRLTERRISITPIGAGAESFRGLMGMQGEMEIWLDESCGALVEIDGDAPGMGAAKVELTSFRR